VGLWVHCPPEGAPANAIVTTEEAKKFTPVIVRMGFTIGAWTTLVGYTPVIAGEPAVTCRLTATVWLPLALLVAAKVTLLL
jgi:hypothetical protein